MRTEEEIKEKVEELKQKLALKIAKACVGYKENVNATIKDIKGQLKFAEWVLEDSEVKDENT